jgi:hypothetical protein
MDETQEAVEKQREITELISGQLTEVSGNSIRLSVVSCIDMRQRLFSNDPHPSRVTVPTGASKQNQSTRHVGE